MSMHPWRRRAIAAAAFTAIGLLLFGYRYLDVLTRGGSDPFYAPLTSEMTGAWGAGLLLLGPVLPLVRKLRGRPRIVALAGHLAILVGFSALHTTWNAVTRQLVYSLFHLGHYDYGIMRFRYPMEFPMDVIVYVLFVSLVTLLDHYNASRDREVRVARLEGEVTRLQLRALEGQLQPHFLFNALNTVSSVMYEDVAAADTMLARLSDLLRRTLRPTATTEVSLHDELETLELYFSIMRARFVDRLDVTTDIAPDVTVAAVPPLLLQPLVENALRHGDPGAGTRAAIALRARRMNGDLVLEVEDNGPGLSVPPDVAIAKGIGLGNTASRLSHLYGADHQFTLVNRAGGGLVVSVVIPFRDASASAANARDVSTLVSS